MKIVVINLLGKLLNSVEKVSIIGAILKQAVENIEIVYINYGDFPRKSNFFHPKNVPHQVYWGRFRLDLDLRLLGFVVPDDYHGKTNIKTGMTYDKNTFYVVFLDPEHNFYITKK